MADSPSPAHDPLSPSHDPQSPVYSPATTSRSSPAHMNPLVEESPSSLKRKRNEYDYTEMIEVKVGDPSAPKTLWVHKDPICTKSKFFRAATSGRWGHWNEKPIPLPEENAQMFAKYIHWVYTEEITVEHTEPHRRELAEFYLLADGLDDVAARNSTMDLLLAAWSERTHKAGCVRLIFDSTPPSSKLRLLTVHTYLDRVSPEFLERHADEYPAAFFHQLAVQAMRWREKPLFGVVRLHRASCKEDVPEDWSEGAVMVALRSW
nr:hypothetical protein B0A51_00437 [Rachicladosporium sp. CCFEE 5018]